MEIKGYSQVKPVVYDVWDNLIGTIQSSSSSPLPKELKEGILPSYMSCGVSILYGIYGERPRDTVYKVLKQRHEKDIRKTKEAFVIFSDTDNDSSTGGNALYKYIRDNQLGDIVEFGPRMNPNSGNRIKMWVWSPPHDSLHPNDKWLPVEGKRLIEDQFGRKTVYVGPDDPRFHENRAGAAREA